MSVVHTVGRGVAWNTAATVSGKLLMLANVFLILHVLTVYEYGFSELVMSVISLMGIILLPGLTSTVMTDMAVERGRKDFMHMSVVFHQHVALNILLGASAWAVLFFGSQPVAELAGNPYAAQFLKIASFTFLIGPLRTLTQVLATVLLRFFDQAFYVVIEEMFKLACLLVFIVWLGFGIKGLMLSIVLSQLLTVIAFLPRTFSAYKSLPRVSLRESLRIRDLLKAHRLWSIGSSHINTLSTNARLWIIKFMLGTEAVGLFSFAWGIFAHVLTLVPLTTVLTAIIPHYVDKRDQLIRMLRASVKFQLVTATVLTVVAMLASEPFVSILFPRYAPALPILYVILLGVIATSVFVLFTPVFVAYKRQRSILGSTVFKGVAIVVILPPAIMLFGLAGTGVEVVLTTFLNGFERYYRLRKLLPGFSLAPRTLLETDAYERAAMDTLVREVGARLRAVLRRG